MALAKSIHQRFFHKKCKVLLSRCEGFYRAGLLLSETKSLNHLLGQSSADLRWRLRDPKDPKAKETSLMYQM